jgi:HPt (histidine-containing phosphotransfer) domain-containing protein
LGFGSVPHSLVEELCLLDGRGVVARLSQAWRKSGERKPAFKDLREGARFTKICAGALDMSPEDALRFMTGVHTILLGQRTVFSVEYIPILARSEQRWVAWATRGSARGGPGVVISRENITERRRLEQSLRGIIRGGRASPSGSRGPGIQETGSRFQPRRLLAELEGDCRVLLKMVDVFEQELPGLLESLKSAVADGDRQRARSTAHGLYGSAWQFCAQATASAALAFEQAVSRGDFKLAAKLLPQLEANLRELAVDLRRFVASL